MPADEPDADEQLHALSDEEWHTAHNAQYGDGSTIPDEQLGLAS